MRKRLIAFVAVAALLGPLAGTANAAASMCEIQRKLGVQNVKECEEPTS
jgi:hypothetical protein